MTQIIGIAGKIGSGKTTLCRYLHGYFMKNLIPNPIDPDTRGIIHSYMINELGQLLVPATAEDGEEESFGIFDPESRDPLVQDFLSSVIWPYIKSYSFAGYLKQICADMYGVTEEQLYGTQEQKATPVAGLLWENMVGSIEPKTRTKKELDLISEAKLVEKSGPMTSRDLMQYLGTDVFRRANPRCHADSCINRVKRDDPAFAIIGDVRFRDTEVGVIRDNGGFTLYLTRDEFKNNHSSETGIGPEDCDEVIDNEKMTIEESCNALIDILKKRSIL